MIAIRMVGLAGLLTASIISRWEEARPGLPLTQAVAQTRAHRGGTGEATDMPGTRGVPSITGAGNFTNGDTGVLQTRMFGSLAEIGAGACRMNLYPAFYYDEKSGLPLPSRLDGLMDEAHRHGITPVILFEYYAEYADPRLHRPAVPLGGGKSGLPSGGISHDGSCRAASGRGSGVSSVGA